MAKKSAKSKGYRRAAEKKPYLTKKDITILCVLVAVVAIGAILLFTYDDGALKVRAGKIVEPGENWLIVNGNTRGGRRYFKLGEAGAIEGFTMETKPYLSDDNLTQFNYTPEAEDSAVTGVTISTSAYDPARLAEGNAQMVASVKGSSVSDVATDKAGELEYTYYTYTHEYYAAEEAEAEEPAAEDAVAEEPAAEDAAEPTEDAPAEAESEPAAEEPTSEEAEAEEPAAEDAAEPTEDAPATEESEPAADEAPNHFEQAMNAYLPAAHNGSIVFTISAKADSAETYLTEDQLKETLNKAIAAVTLEPGK